MVPTHAVGRGDEYFEWSIACACTHGVGAHLGVKLTHPRFLFQRLGKLLLEMGHLLG